MTELLTFVSLIKAPKGEKNQNKGNNGTKNVKLKILLETIGDEDYLVSTVCSNREAKKALKRLKRGELVYITLGTEGSHSFFKDTPNIHVSDFKVINFYKEKEV